MTQSPFFPLFLTPLVLAFLVAGVYVVSAGLSRPATAGRGADARGPSNGGLHDGVTRLGWWLTALALVLHAVLLAHGFVAADRRVGGAQSASAFGLLAGLVLWAARRAEPLGPLVWPVHGLAGLAALAGAWLVPGPETARIDSWQGGTHAGLSIAAGGLMMLALLQALVLSAQERTLRQHGRMSAVALKLPPLMTMERLLFTLIRWGFVALTLALLSGFLFIENIFAQHLLNKVVLSIIAWAVYAALLWGREKRGWRGQQAVRWTWAGFIVLGLAYFGTKFVLEVLLGRHWGEA